MKKRWTIKELDKINDKDFIKAILRERKSELHPYAPLARRINKVLKKLK